MVSIGLQAQSKTIDLTLPEVSVYDLSDGFSSHCFEKTFQDSSGLLWLKYCAFVDREYNSHFITFDGHTPSVPKLSGDKFGNGAIVQAVEMNADGIIYGIFTNEIQRKNGLFFLDTKSRHLSTFESSELAGDGNLHVTACQIDGEALIVLFSNEVGIEIKRLDFEGNLIRNVASNANAFIGFEENDVKRNVHDWEFVHTSYITYHDGNYLMLAGGMPFLKYNETEATWKNIAEAELGESYADYVDSIQEPPFLIPRANGDFEFVLPNTKAGTLHYDFKSDTFSEQTNLRPLVQNKRITVQRSTRAEEISVIRNFKEQPIDFYNFLYHADGSLDSLKIPHDVRSVYHCFKSAISGNLIISTDAGLFVVRNEENKPAKAYMKPFPARGLVPMSESKVLVSMSASGRHIGVLDLEKDSVLFYEFPQPFSNHSVGKFVKRKDGKIWTTGYKVVGLIDFEASTITKIKNHSHVFERFDLLNDSTFLLLDNDELYAWNPVTNLSELLYSHPEIIERLGYVHELMLHSNGDVYAAFGNGLLRISKDFKSHEFVGSEQGADDFKVLSITEDKNGRLWLGTYEHGVQVYDPESDGFASVQISEGLLSNTVATIEDDGKGYMWAGTFNGVSCIEINSLEVVTTLTESDGLANNESNRFSSARFPDGRIIIGSIKGFSVIDPSFIHSKSSSKNPPKIFLSAAYWKDGRSEETTSGNVQKGTIELPANDRNLRLDLALTDYLQPNLHKFIYKIGDGPWQFAGTNRSLYINSLTHGSYDIQVKGIDHLGNETANVLKIPIHVLPFFYQQWWFYLLCSIPFILFGIAWVRRQERIKEELTIEVELATEKLRKDKLLIESQTAQLQELDKLKSRFFTNISHEFRTPLSVILGIANTLNKHKDEQIKSSVGLIQKNTNILLNLINQILDLVKLEAGELQTEYIQSDILSFIKQVVDGIRPLSDSKNITLNFESDSPELVIDFDQNKTFRILANLLSNAIKFTPEGGKVIVSATSESGFFKLTVTDTGRGIDQQSLPLIFDRFYQVDSSATREGEGTGVGLNFTKELVELLKGSIEVESTVGKGTQFNVKLPISKEAELRDIDQLQPDINLMVPASNSESEETKLVNQDDLPLLLVIEDNADIAKLLVLILSTSYRIETAENGQIGIDRAIELVPDFILSDVMMPVKDGVQVLDELKNNPITSHIPIILLTAKADMDSQLEGLRRGADDYVSKPFHEEELKLRIKNILDAKKRIQSRYELGAPIESVGNPETELDDVFILELQRVLEANLDNSEFGINDFCSELGVSRMQLHNKLKALTGLSTSNYIRSLRLIKAKELVLSSSLNVSEISYSVGFSSPAYFSRSFSEKFGSSPTEMREKQA